METPGGGYVLFLSQGDHGLPGEHGPPGQKGVGEPGAKVRKKGWMAYWRFKFGLIEIKVLTKYMNIRIFKLVPWSSVCLCQLELPLASYPQVVRTSEL